jgi:hypothetical protein
MSEYVSRKDFEETVAALKAALETAIVQASVASNFAFVALLDTKDLGQTIRLLEEMLEAGSTIFLFSSTTDAQIDKYRQYYLS